MLRMDLLGTFRLLLLAISSVVGAHMGSIAQVDVVSGSYAMDFGTSDITTWTNNITFQGWYHTMGSFGGHVNVTGAAPVNTGGFYSYECNGNNDQKIGSRASGSATPVRFGVILRNQTGLAIQSLRVTYRGFQLSLAQNGNVVNTTAFDFVTGASPPSITAPTGTSVATLGFQQLQSSATAGSNQINGYPCDQSVLLSTCIDLPVPLAMDHYVLLRWTDVNDVNNDHHMAIDDVLVDFDLTGFGCNVLLPVELLTFSARSEPDHVVLLWSTGSESGNDRFVVERSEDGIDFNALLEIPGMGNTQERTDYQAIDHHPLDGQSYYRLRQIDLDGACSLSPTVSVEHASGNDMVRILYGSGNEPVQVLFADALSGERYWLFDAAGRHVIEGTVPGPLIEIPPASRQAGILTLLVGAQKPITARIFLR